MSLVISTGAVRPDLLRETLASLAAQTSPYWEAILVGENGPAVQGGERVRAGTGVADATGDMVGFIDAGDQLAPSAVEAAARLLAAEPALRLLYTDEDRIAGDGTRSGAVLKPGWSPDLLLAGDAVGQLALFRREAAASGLAAEAGRYGILDLALRVTHDAPPGTVAHLPGVLFHRGRGRTARPPPFPHSRAGIGDAALDAVIDRHLAMRRPELQRGTRRLGSRLWPTVTATLPSPAPLVSVIVPTKDRAALLEECLSGLLGGATDYPALEVLVVDNGSTEEAALNLLAGLAGDRRVRVLRSPGPFNWSALNNAAAAQASGDVLLLLNNDISVVRPGWLRSMAGHVMRPDVGIVGARLLFPDGRLQHGGVLLGPQGAAVHAYTGANGDDPGYLGQVAVLRDLSAVTGACLAIRRAVWRQVGGLEQEQLRVAWSDIDLCLRVREAGYRVLWDPEATLVHHEMATRGQDVSLSQQARHEVERAWVRRRWPEATERDPFLNPALRANPDALLLAPVPVPGAAA